MNSALLYYRMGLDHCQNPETYFAGKHKLVLMSFEATKYVPGLRHYLFFFRDGANTPDYSYVYEISDSGTFFGSWEGEIHRNYGKTKANMTFDQFKSAAFNWVAKREGFDPCDVSQEKPKATGGFFKKLFG
jgi:hypothetical protein